MSSSADDDNTLFFRIGHRTLTSRKLTGKFPNYEAVMPRDNNKFVVVRSEDLMGSIQRVAQLPMNAREPSRSGWSRMS